MLINRAYPFLLHNSFFIRYLKGVGHLLPAVIGRCKHIVKGFGCGFVGGLYGMTVYIDKR